MKKRGVKNAEIIQEALKINTKMKNPFDDYPKWMMILFIVTMSFYVLFLLPKFIVKIFL